MDMTNSKRPLRGALHHSKFRFTDDDRALLVGLAERLGLSHVGVVRLALRTLARRRFAQEEGR